ncbi:MAG: hypothetical protein A4S14_11110 [Proteobacteria bacterium SG_bin9]|nr:MAG: hypothetical protein A4S14_11110 [Proteobacteria bacterium SG_bin9]
MYLPDQGFSVEVSPTVRSVLPDPWGWEDRRKWYRDRGVTFAGILTTEGFANVQGGIRRGAIFDGKFEGIVGVDFGRLAGWNGLSLFSNIFQTHGNGGPGRSLINGIDTISNIEALPSIRLSELWLEQRFWEGKASFRIGQLTTDSEFYNSQYFNVFLTSDWPTITAEGLPGGGPAYPLSTPGMRLKLDPTPNHSMLLALFNGDPAGCGTRDPEICNRHGLNFRVKDPPLLIGELQYRRNQDPNATGLASGIRLGAYHHFGTFNDLRFDTLGLSLADPASSGVARRFRGNQGVYAVFDQQFYRPAGGDAFSGITGFLRVGAATSNRNLNDFYLEGGLLSTGMIPGRPLDQIGAVFLYSHISDRARGLDRDQLLFSMQPYPLRNYELSFELSYAASVVPGWTLQPNIQYVIQPSGNIPDPNRPFTTEPIKNALVFGIRSTLRY